MFIILSNFQICVFLNWFCSWFFQTQYFFFVKNASNFECFSSNLANLENIRIFIHLEINYNFFNFWTKIWDWKGFVHLKLLDFCCYLCFSSKFPWISHVLKSQKFRFDHVSRLVKLKKTRNNASKKANLLTIEGQYLMFQKVTNESFLLYWTRNNKKFSKLLNSAIT